MLNYILLLSVLTAAFTIPGHNASEPLDAAASPAEGDGLAPGLLWSHYTRNEITDGGMVRHTCAGSPDERMRHVYTAETRLRETWAAALTPIDAVVSTDNLDLLSSGLYVLTIDRDGYFGAALIDRPTSAAGLSSVLRVYSTEALESGEFLPLCNVFYLGDTIVCGASAEVRARRREIMLAGKSTNVPSDHRETLDFADHSVEYSLAKIISQVDETFSGAHQLFVTLQAASIALAAADTQVRGQYLRGAVQDYYEMIGFNKIMHDTVLPAPDKLLPDQVHTPRVGIAAQSAEWITTLAPLLGVEAPGSVLTDLLTEAGQPSSRLFTNCSHCPPHPAEMAEETEAAAIWMSTAATTAAEVLVSNPLTTPAARAFAHALLLFDLALRTAVYPSSLIDFQEYSSSQWASGINEADIFGADPAAARTALSTAHAAHAYPLISKSGLNALAGALVETPEGEFIAGWLAQLSADAYINAVAPFTDRWGGPQLRSRGPALHQLPRVALMELSQVNLATVSGAEEPLAALAALYAGSAPLRTQADIIGLSQPCLIGLDAYADPDDAAVLRCRCNSSLLPGVPRGDVHYDVLGGSCLRAPADPAAYGHTEMKSMAYNHVRALTPQLPVGHVLLDAMFTYDFAEGLDVSCSSVSLDGVFLSIPPDTWSAGQCTQPAWSSGGLVFYAEKDGVPSNELTVLRLSNVADSFKTSFVTTLPLSLCHDVVVMWLPDHVVGAAAAAIPESFGSYPSIFADSDYNRRGWDVVRAMVEAVPGLLELPHHVKYLCVHYGISGDGLAGTRGHVLITTPEGLAALADPATTFDAGGKPPVSVFSYDDQWRKTLTWPLIDVQTGNRISYGELSTQDAAVRVTQASVSPQSLLAAACASAEEFGRVDAKNVYWATGASYYSCIRDGSDCGPAPAEVDRWTVQVPGTEQLVCGLCTPNGICSFPEEISSPIVVQDSLSVAGLASPGLPDGSRLLAIAGHVDEAITLQNSIGPAYVGKDSPLAAFPASSAFHGAAPAGCRVSLDVFPADAPRSQLDAHRLAVLERSATLPHAATAVLSPLRALQDAGLQAGVVVISFSVLDGDDNSVYFEEADITALPPTSTAGALSSEAELVKTPGGVFPATAGRPSSHAWVTRSATEVMPRSVASSFVESSPLALWPTPSGAPADVLATVVLAAAATGQLFYTSEGLVFDISGLDLRTDGGQIFVEALTASTQGSAPWADFARLAAVASGVLLGTFFIIAVLLRSSVVVAQRYVRVKCTPPARAAVATCASCAHSGLCLPLRRWVPVSDPICQTHSPILDQLVCTECAYLPLLASAKYEISKAREDPSTRAEFITYLQNN